MNVQLIGNNLTMRLLGDPTKQAAVEIYDGFTWWSVCATYWNLRAADLVCRHFGYEFVLGALKIPVEAELSQPKMIQFHCPLSSAVYESLLQCSANTNAICLCSKQRAGVICSKGESLPPPLIIIRGLQLPKNNNKKKIPYISLPACREGILFVGAISPVSFLDFVGPIAWAINLITWNFLWRIIWSYCIQTKGVMIRYLLQSP